MLRDMHIASLVFIYALWTVILHLHTAKRFVPLNAYYESGNSFCVYEMTLAVSTWSSCVEALKLGKGSGKLFILFSGILWGHELI